LNIEKTRRYDLKKLVFLLAMAFVASGCSPVAINTTDHHAFNEEARLSSQPEYRIEIGDELQIKFAFNPELNEEHIPVRPDGRISVPLAKQIKVAGLTTQELEDILAQKYASELKKPEVTVIVRGFNAQKIFVDGEVNRPGLVPMMGPLTALQSISESGGFKDTARLTEVIVIRRTQDKPVVAILDLKKARENNDMSQDILLMPSDIVYVPRSKIADVDLFVDLYIRRLIPFPLPEVFPTPGYVYPAVTPTY
jgi:protein involved in polysaccharide export with SLBB domain